jgi:hypothetical protein
MCLLQLSRFNAEQIEKTRGGLVVSSPSARHLIYGRSSKNDDHFYREW